MVAETTVNIGRDTLEKLSIAADCTGLAKSRMISVLLHRFARGKRLYLPDVIRVRYQKKRAEEDWRCLHVSINRDEYEFYNDLRNLCKFSISFLIAHAIENFLDEVVKLLMNDVDSYRYQNYAIYQFMDNGIICWVRCWGIPTQIIPNTGQT